jgi:predicted neuraminidase
MKNRKAVNGMWGCGGVAAAFAFQAAGGAVVTAEFVNDPMPTPQCHASTIAESGGGLVAAWFGGTHERHSDVGIWLSRQENGKWTPAVEVANGNQADGTRLPCWNPVLHPAKDGSLVLFFKIGPDCTWWWGERMVSRDGGRTWSKPARLPNGMIGPIKNKPLTLRDGRTLCGASTEFGPWLVHVETTPDDGVTWTRTGHLHGKNINAIQPSFLVHPDNTLQMLGRTKEKRLFSIFSADNGATWGEMTLLDVPNPNSGTDALTLRDGRYLLVYNPVEKGRSPLTVALSDDGKTWRDALTLESEKGEFSYPAVIQAADGKIHITYTWKRLKVKHVVADPGKF